ncbi:hypothetical protein D3C85_273190 [compost metagenome]
MAGITPPLLTKGRYTLVEPFTALPTVIYTCAALRTFDECLAGGLDVLNAIYIHEGLTKTEYDRDYKAGKKIVTLMSDTETPIYVPDSYIESFPNFDAVNYNHVIGSFDLGALPDFLNLTNLQLEVAALVSDVVGKEPIVKIHRGASSGIISPAQHEVAEVARLAAISRRTTYRAENIKLRAQVTTLEEQNAVLVNLLKANGIL